MSCRCAFYDFLAQQWSRASAIATVAGLLVCAVGLNLFTSWDSQKIWYRHELDSIGLLRKYDKDWTAAAVYYKGASVPTDTIAITAAGIIPYYTDLYTIDQLGLIAPDLSGYIHREKPRAGHALLASGEYIFKLRPQFIIGHPKMFPDSADVVANLFLEESWYPELQKEYVRIPVHLTTSPPRYMAYALRKDIVAAMMRVSPGTPADTTAPGPQGE